MVFAREVSLQDYLFDNKIVTKSGRSMAATQTWKKGENDSRCRNHPPKCINSLSGIYETDNFHAIATDLNNSCTVHTYRVVSMLWIHHVA